MAYLSDLIQERLDDPAYNNPHVGLDYSKDDDCVFPTLAGELSLLVYVLGTIVKPNRN